jgi:aminopeptidase N
MKIYLSVILIFFVYLGNCQSETGVEECLEGKTLQFQRNAKSARMAHQNFFPGDANIDVNYYKLNLNLTYVPANLTAVVTIKAKSMQATLKEAVIDLQNALKVDSIFVNKARTTFTHENAKITVNLLKNYTQNEQFTLDIHYHGKPGSSGFGSFEFGDHGPVGAKRPAIWSLSEPFGASDWFPCKDNPADKADSSDVWITAPKQFVSVSNGVLEQKIENDSTNTYRWKSRYPIANYLISIACAEYKIYKNEFNYGGTKPMPVEHYVYEEVFTDANKLLMDETVYMLDLFTKKFGPYPFVKEKYGHAMFGWGGGMEHQTCTSLVNFSSGLVAHELAHQWFGDKITCADWANIWLNEGFATYGAFVYWEAKLGAETYKNQIVSAMASARKAKGSVWVQNPVSVGEIFNGARSYNKGGIVLHMLRKIVGDDQFYAILKDYIVSKSAYANAATEDFQKSAEKISGLNLDYFFKQWIYGENYPVYNFGWSQNPTTNQGKYTVNLNIKQAVNSKTPAFFTMPIALKVTFDDNTSQIITAFNNKQEQMFDFEFAKKVKIIEFDPDNGILKDLTVSELNLPLANEPLSENNLNLQVSPNPADEDLKVSFSLKQPSGYVIVLFSANGRKIFQLDNSKTSVIGKQEIALKTNKFANGIYTLLLKTGQSDISEKVIVMH